VGDERRHPGADPGPVVLFLVFYILIFAIAGLNYNTMIMIISRRTKEIGILMAMSATRQPSSIFMLESLILAPPAALLGSILAFLAARLIMSYDIQLPLRSTWYQE
jgi:lipoprotein-releasing system permease protein